MKTDVPFSNFHCNDWFKQLREDEFDVIETRAPHLVSLVRTMAGAEIQEAVTSLDKNSITASEPVRAEYETKVLSPFLRVRQAGG